MNNEFSGKVVVYNGNPLEAEMVLDMLQNYGINAYLRNQLLGYIAPWYLTPGGVKPVEVEVPKEDRGTAIKLIHAYHKN